MVLDIYIVDEFLILFALFPVGVLSVPESCLCPCFLSLSCHLPGTVDMDLLLAMEVHNAEAADIERNETQLHVRALALTLLTLNLTLTPNPNLDPKS